MAHSEAYLKGSEAAMNGEFRAVAGKGYKLFSTEFNDWYEGYDCTFNPAASERAMMDRSVSRLNNMAG